jgi:chromosome partitioning protein
MRSILVLNAKGGCGKTTIATNLAGYYADQGQKVSLVDFDPQGSSTDWAAARPDNRPRISAIPIYDGRRHRIPPDTEVMIMDAPASTHDKALANIMRRAQTVLIPVLPSPIDIRAAERFLVELGGIRKVLDTNVKIAAIANRVRENTRNANSLEDFLGSLKLPNGKRMPFLTMLRSSKNYLDAANRGLSIFEFAPMATVRDREEWAPLVRWLGSKRSIPDEK